MWSTSRSVIKKIYLETINMCNPVMTEQIPFDKEELVMLWDQTALS